MECDDGAFYSPLYLGLPRGSLHIYQCHGSLDAVHLYHLYMILEYIANKAIVLPCLDITEVILIDIL